MLEIAQELKVYAVIGEDEQNCDYLACIMNLWQVQVSNCSYVLIKEPYTDCLTSYLRILKEHRADD